MCDDKIILTFDCCYLGYFPQPSWTSTSSGWSMATESEPALSWNPCPGITGKTAEIPSQRVRNGYSRMCCCLEKAYKYTKRFFSSGRGSPHARYFIIANKNVHKNKGSVNTALLS